MQGNRCAVQTRVCGIRELCFSDDCAGVRPHEMRSCAGELEESERYTGKLMVTVLVARPLMADLVLGVQDQR